VKILTHGAFGEANPVDHEHDWFEADGVFLCWCEATAEPLPTKKVPLLNKTVRALIYRQRDEHEKAIERLERSLANSMKESDGYEKAIAKEKEAIAELDEALDLETEVAVEEVPDGSVAV
jgi:septal ring factor EnvC (AmiA/AmiB activator)